MPRIKKGNIALKKRANRMNCSKKIEKKLWDKLPTIRNRNPNLYRRSCDQQIIYKYSRTTKGKMGWHVDHKKALAKGGSNNIRNLQIISASGNLKKSCK